MIEKRGNRTWYRAVKSFYKLGKKGRVIHVVASMAACLTIALSTPALAGAATETISDARTATQTLSSGDSIEVTEEGSITVENANAIDASSGMNGSSILNKGSISVTIDQSLSQTSGIYAKDVRNSSSITNDGTIEIKDTSNGSRAYGINVLNLNNSSVENSGIISMSANSGYQYGIRNSGTGTVTNSGTISLSAVSSMYMFGIFNKEDATVTNAKTISVSADSAGEMHGIYNRGDATVTNSKTISLSAGSADFMFGISNNGNGKVTNSGETSLSAVSALKMVGIINKGDATVTNSGTISVSADSANFMFGLENQGAGAVTNAKTISLSADSTGTMVGLKNTGDGTVTNSGTISVSADSANSIYGIYNNGLGMVTNSGTITATTGTGELNDSFYSVRTQGGLTNEKTGTLKGQLMAGKTTNSGKILLSLGTSSINGDFHQDKDGTLGITLYNDASGIDFSKLSVAGTATLDDKSKIYVDVTTTDANQPLLIGQTLTGVIDSTGGITAETSTLAIDDNSTLLKFTAALSNGDRSLDLTVEKGMSILDATKEGGRSGVKGAAAVLDGLSGTTNPEIISFIKYLNDQNSPGRVADQVAGAAPVHTTQTPAVSGQLVNTMSAVLQARQNSARGLNSGEPVFSDKNLWIKPFAVTMDQDDVDGVNGFSADAYGFGMGMDGELSSTDRLGLAFFYTGADTKTNNLAQESDTDVFNLMAYGSRPVYNKSFTLFWQAGGGIQEMASSRYIQALNQTAKADYTAKHLFAMTRASRVFPVTQDVTLSAGAAVSYTWFYTPSYTESNAGGMNLSVGSSDTQSLVTALEGGVAWSAAKDVQITAKASIGYDLIDDDTWVSSRFQGGGVSFATQGIDNSPVVYTANLGVGRKLGNRLSLDASYDLEGRGDDFLSHMLSVKLNWTF